MCYLVCLMDAKKIAPESFKATAANLKAAGTNSRKVGGEKAFKALLWVYRWGWSYPFLVDHIASPNRRGLCKKLVEQKLLSSFDCPGAGGKKGLPNSVVCLTKDGQMLVESELSESQFLDQNLQEDIPWHQLYHDALVQRATGLKSDLLEFKTPKEIAEKSDRGVKQADAIWILKSGQRIGVELELTAKKRGREFDQTILSLLHSVNPNGNPHQLDAIALVCRGREDGILGSYRERLKPGKKITLWERDPSRKWVESEKTATVPDWAAGRFHFQLLEI